jgi:hypothetical protein
LQENRQIRILSRPLIRTLDNQPAFIQVGQRVPRIVGSTVGISGQSNSITLENVGLILGVTPRISPDGRVIMEIDAEKSSIGPEEEGIPVAVSTEGTIIRSPRVDTATAQATVSAADGETVVLGGMIANDEEIVSRRAPYLADIPILGHLFRYDSTMRRRTELLIILTPKVIRTMEDAERIKQAEFARVHWCAADVYELYGDIGLDYSTQMTISTEGQHEDTPVIYPDVNPRGELPEPQPATEPGPTPMPRPDMPGPAQRPLPARPGTLQPPIGQETRRPGASGYHTAQRPPGGVYPAPPAAAPAPSDASGNVIQQPPPINHSYGQQDPRQR